MVFSLSMKSAKFKFVAIHLVVSMCVALLTMYIVFFCWYLLPLNKATGVTHLFLMMLAIDIILGPFLVWLVYKEGKKSLKFDLCVIILIQIIALSYGVFKIADGRPVWIIYNVDRFELIRNNEIVIESNNQIKSDFRQASWFQPRFASTEFAKDSKQRNREMFAEITTGISIAQRPERYVSLFKAKQQIQQRAQSLGQLTLFNDKRSVETLLSRYPQANAYLPLKANALDMTVLVNKDTAEIIKIVDLRPWK